MVLFFQEILSTHLSLKETFQTEYHHCFSAPNSWLAENDPKRLKTKTNIDFQTEDFFSKYQIDILGHRCSHKFLQEAD